MTVGGRGYHRDGRAPARFGAAGHRRDGAPAVFTFSPYVHDDPTPVPGARSPGWQGRRPPPLPAAAAAHEAALARLGEGHCPDCSGRLTAHRGSTFTLAVDIGHTDTGGSALLGRETPIPAHGYCPACRLCVEDVSDEWDEPVYATWEGCPLVELPADAIRVSSDHEHRDGAL
jgi:hypothetical protein